MRVNQLIDALRICSSGCHVNNFFIGYILYSDDILLLSAFPADLQALLNVCDQSVSLKFNCRKYLCIAFGPKYDAVIADMKLGESTIC